MKIYVVKYALTDGIFEADADIDSKGRAFIRDAAVLGYICYPKEYDITLEDARFKAYAMRDKKIASLKKQISKLEKMEF